MISSSEALADFSIALRDQSLPEEVSGKAAEHLLDVLGVCAAASRQEFAPAVRTVAAGLGGGPEAVGVSLAGRLAAPNAALLNGVLAHGLDYDDTHLAAVVHPSAPVTPAAVAVAEEIDASGEDLLKACALGLEAAVRIGLAASGGFHERGFHPTPICGVIGAALAAGTLYRLSRDELVWSIGLAASMSSGLMEFLGDGSSSKRFHGGWAAHGGILAARLGRQGLTGPRGAIDGRYGLLRAMLGESATPARVTSELGRRWEMLDIALKPYPCCHFLHAFLDLADRLRSELGAQPGHAAPAALLDKISQIECAIPPLAIPVVCEPVEFKRRPRTSYDAQFSLPFSVALMLARGHATLADFAGESIRDPGLLALADRVTVREDPRDDFPRRFPGRMRIVLEGGNAVEGAQDDNRGGPSAPLSRAEIEAKFRANALPLLGEEGVGGVLALFARRPLAATRRLMAPFARGEAA